MALKIVKHTEEAKNVSNIKTFSFNIETLLQKTFFLCSKVVDFANEVLSRTDFKSIITAPTDEIFEEKFLQLQRSMNVFSLMFGNKISMVDALTKATTTMKNLQLLAQKFDVQLVANNTESDIPLTNEDIDIMVQMMKDFGEKEIRENVKTYNEEVKNRALEKQKEQSELVDVYDVYEERNS